MSKSSNETAEKIREVLERELEPTRLDIVDESHLHAGHAGAKAGGGHFYAEIVSPKFVGKSTLERQRMVYAALGDLMKKEIHAFSMKCIEPV